MLKFSIKKTNFIMKKTALLLLVALFIGLSISFAISKVDNADAGIEPWQPEQLMEPALLAKKLTSTEKHPIIFNIGPSGVIKGAIDIDSSGIPAA
jgi:hypothetical protein